MKTLTKTSALVLLLTTVAGCAPVLPPGPPVPPGGMSVSLWQLLSTLMTCLFPLLTLAALVTTVGVIVYLLHRRGISLTSLGPASPSARDVARLRYAQGEIGEEEYRRILAGIAEAES